jgi:hypothetical protein
MSYLNRVKRLERIRTLSEGTDYLLIIRPKGADKAREQEKGETLQEYMAFLDGQGIRYVYCKV